MKTTRAKQAAKRKSGAKPAATKRGRKKPAAGQGWIAGLRSRLGRSFFLRFTVAFAAIVVLVPFLLLLVYRIEAVHPVSTLMIRDTVLGTGARREWIELEDMAPVVFQSVMMSEDGRFCSHRGIDWAELNAVIDDAIEGEKTRGASTITMQLVKNLFLWPNRSLVRKALEVPYSMMAELVLGKKRIMEIYLNVVELDRGVFGVEAAAQHYFGRSAAKLGRRQAALLAVTLPNPVARNPAKPTRKLGALARTIQRRARASGAYIKCLTQG